MIKLFTHTDLDGAGCAVLAKLCWNNDVDITYLGNGDVDTTLLRFIKTEAYKHFNKIYITDLSCGERVAETINELVSQKLSNWRLLDHHKTALALNKYSWVCVQTEYEPVDVQLPPVPTCGTSLLRDELVLNHDVKLSLHQKLFAETVRLWDTWQWQGSAQEALAVKLSTLLKLRGYAQFVDNLVKNIRMNKLLSVEEEEAVNNELKRKEDYIKSKLKTVMEYEFEGKKFAAVFANEYVSELGNSINKFYPNYSGAILVTEYGLSFRTIHDDVDVSEIARKFGGGGHQKAAGVTFNEDQKRRVLDGFFKE